jgi:hypothetical protein
VVRLLGYLYGKRSGLKIARAIHKEDDREGAGQSRETLWRAMTHIESTGTCMMEITAYEDGTDRVF